MKDFWRGFASNSPEKLHEKVLEIYVEKSVEEFVKETLNNVWKNRSQISCESLEEISQWFSEISQKDFLNEPMEGLHEIPLEEFSEKNLLHFLNEFSGRIV